MYYYITYCNTYREKSFISNKSIGGITRLKSLD